MSRFWHPDVHKLSPYVPGEQPRSPGLVKLNTNELPFGPSPRVLEALSRAADERLRLYPDPENTRLREAWADAVGLQPEQVFPGNGSDEVLAHCFRALFRDDAPVLFPDITYSFYPVYCQLFGLAYQRPGLDTDFRIDLADYRVANGGIIFPNPNAPTGMAMDLDAIRSLLAHNRDSVVVVDEAYVNFGASSACALVDEFPNLLVVQTLSKSHALAGLRVGAALGSPELIEGLSRVKNSFNSYPLGQLAEVGAVAALEDRDWLREATARVCRSRETLSDGLQALGFEVLPSQANFLMTRHPGHSGEELQRALRQHNILVRHFAAPRISDYLRITVGTEAQCSALLDALREILSAS